MKVSFVPIKLPQEKELLVTFLTTETWPFHVNNQLTSDKVVTMFDDGLFDGNNHECFWILDEAKKVVGFIRLFDIEDIDDGYPLFDLRIRNANRGQGLGKQSIDWLTKYLFEKWPQLERIAGTTRVDNSSMRKLFRAAGYVKEGHYRKDWATSNGELYDTVKYSILREDWETGTKTAVNWDDEK